MSDWHAVVPIKPVAERKMRLRSRLDDRQVRILTERMLGHVLTVLTNTPGIAEVTLLAVAPHPAWQGRWHPDRGAGLNAALYDIATAIPRRLLIVHADLPALGTADVAALLAGAATAGAAIAPDRHGTGTNAVALTDAIGFAFAFGTDSFSRHRHALPSAQIVSRHGLALDIDLPGDLALLDVSFADEG